MLGGRLTRFRCASVATVFAGWDAYRSKNESRRMTTVIHFPFSKTKHASVCAPTDPVLLASPTNRQGWNAGGRTVPEHMFEFSKKMPAIGADGDSKKLLTDALQEARTASDVTYAKIGQCNEDQLAKRLSDHVTYPPHLYDRDGFRVLMHAVLGLADGREFESSAAKANHVLQDVRLNEQLEPNDMANGMCAGTAARPIAIYMYPVHKKFDGQAEQLSLDVESHKRAIKQSFKEPSDRQQEDEDGEIYGQRLKFLNAKRCSEAKSSVEMPHKRSKENVAKPKKNFTTSMSMDLLDARKNKLLGSWSATPSPFEHRALVESKYIIDAIKKQLGPDAGATKLNELTGPYAFHSVLTKLNGSEGLSGFPTYAAKAPCAALHQALKNRWLAKPAASTTLSKFFGSGSAST